MCNAAPQEFTTLDDLKKFPNLRKLYLNECRVENNEALGELEELVLYGNQIEEISSLRNLKKLTKFNLDENLIEDVEPLADLTNLKELYLQDNPIKNMDSLKNLTGTKIRN